MKKKSVLSILGGLVIFIACIGLVRGDAVKPWSQSDNASQRFVVLAEYNNEAVLDRTTGLIWEQSPEISSDIDWNQALQSCLVRSHPFVGGSLGWRLPKYEELGSLYKVTAGGQNFNISLPPNHPFGDTNADFWTSSESTDRNSARTFAGGGGLKIIFVPKTNLNKSWCVRGGSN
jgi:hypothetical protein